MGVGIKIQQDHLQGVGDHCLQDGWPLNVHVSILFCMFCLQSFWIVLMSIYPTETTSSGKRINKWCLVYILVFQYNSSPENWMFSTKPRKRILGLSVLKASCHLGYGEPVVHGPWMASLGAANQCQ